ncbi:MAG: SDR family NAD(P)-dependent oxidoreductase [Desulfobaccales bacterium]
MVAVSEINSLPERFYEVAWKPQNRYSLTPNYIPSPAAIYPNLLLELSRLLDQPGMPQEEKIFSELEDLSIVYVLAAFSKLGWKWEVGRRFSQTQIASELGIIEQHHQLLGRLLEMLSEDGILRRRGDLWEVAAIPDYQDPDEFFRARCCPEARPEIKLLKRCGARLAEVLRGKCSALELLFPEGDFAELFELYQESVLQALMNKLVTKAVLAVLEHLPQGRGCRILEIGAGTGGTTSHLLPHLPALQVEYVFTDIARVFLHKAKAKFQNYPFVRYSLLDIEQEPTFPNNEPDRYDLIVAANVLHATQNLSQTLSHIHQLLLPGGMLVLLEGTAPVRWLDLVFGLTDGWWRFADYSLRPSYPLMSVVQWEALLKEHGFGDMVSISPNESLKLGLTSSQPVLHPQAVLLAQKAAAIPESLPKRNWLILADEHGIGLRLKDRLDSSGGHCSLVFPGESYEQVSEHEFRVNPAQPDHFHRLIKALPQPTFGVVHLWSLDIPAFPTGIDSQSSVTDILDKASLLSCGSTLHLLQAMADQDAGKTCLCLVTRGAQSVEAQSTVPGLPQSPLWGMGKIIALEQPHLDCLRLDLDPQDQGMEDQVIFDEINNVTLEDQVAWRQGRRYAARLVLHQPVSPCEESGKPEVVRPGNFTCRSEASYLITGGLGGLGLLTAQWLIAHGARFLVLLDRHAPGPVAKDQVQKLQEGDVKIVLAQADISNAAQVLQIFQDINIKLPPLRGIIHTAGVIDDSSLGQLNLERLIAVMAPKVKGAWLLHAMTASPDYPLDFFVMFSSAITMVGNLGQANYAAANAFLDCLAHYRRSQGLPGLAVNWGPWSEIGMVSRYPSAVKWLERIGIGSIAPPRGLLLLEYLLSQPAPQVGVMSIDWPRFLEQYGLENKPFFADIVNKP